MEYLITDQMSEVEMKNSSSYDPRPICILVVLSILILIFSVLTWQIMLT